MIPIYGDLPSLAACIESLKQNVDLTRNCILLVNDCGPDADVIEANLLAQINGCESIRYERNERNLGFVRTCNRAVAELDTTDNDVLLLNSDTVTTPGFLQEMSAVLHLSPLHGIVCARSNNAWIANFPETLRDPSIGFTIDRTEKTHGALSGIIRRYSIAPVVPGFCYLIRRRLIHEHGLFDPCFEPGYFEEFDFCMRMNERGYSSVLANRALVFHIGSRSFLNANGANLLYGTNRNLFYQRYPFFGRAFRAYLLDRDPVDAFADTLAPADEVRRVLIDIDVIPATGLPEDARALIAASQQASNPKRLVVTLSTPDDQRDSVAAQYPALEVIGHSRLNRLWDVALTSADTASCTQLIRLNRVSPRWIFTSTGISGVRKWRKRDSSASKKALVQDAFRHSDGIIALRSGVMMELYSYAGSAIMDLPTDGILELESVDGPRIVQEIVDKYGRSVIDVARLRARWDYFARLELYQPERLIKRAIRWVECAAPRAAGRMKNIVHKYFG